MQMNHKIIKTNAKETNINFKMLSPFITITVFKGSTYYIIPLSTSSETLKLL